MSTVATRPSAVLHADADAFFVGVERRHDASLCGRPVAVADRVVCCASYEARDHGVRGGLSTREATRRCPGLVVVPPSAERYARASRDLFGLFAGLATTVEAASMEEAFLAPRDDVAPVAVARELRRRADVELGLPVSVGVAGSRLWAKVASRRAKPDGVVHLGTDEVDRLRDLLPLAEVWSVGPRTTARLEEVGLATLGDVAAVDPTALRDLVGTRMARRLRAIVTGTDVEPLRLAPRRRRSTSAQAATRPVPAAAAVGHAAELAERVASRLRAAEQVGDTVALELVAMDGDRAHVAARLASPTHDVGTLVTAVADLTDAPRVRSMHDVVLVRVTLSGLAPRADGVQLVLPFDRSVA